MWQLQVNLKLFLLFILYTCVVNVPMLGRNFSRGRQRQYDLHSRQVMTASCEHPGFSRSDIVLVLVLVKYSLLYLRILRLRQRVDVPDVLCRDYLFLFV